MRSPLALAAIGLTLTACGPERRFDLPPERATVASITTEAVPMRDGARLATDVYLPAPRVGSDLPSDGPFPTILIRTPYSRTGYPMYINTFGDLLARYGYAVVIQDVRGRFASEGDWYPLANEVADSADTGRWVLAQPWCNGELGLLGASYLTITAWAAEAALGDAVKAMVLHVGSTDVYGMVYERGELRQDVASAWALAMRDESFHLLDVRHYPRMTRAWPPTAGDDVTVGALPFYDDMLRHPVKDAYWQRDFGDPAPAATAPTLMVTGWYDLFLSGQLQDWARLGSRDKSKLVVGPWTHVWGLFEMPVLDYGKEADARPLVDLSLDWFDQHLQHREARHPEGPVRTFEVGGEGWQTSESWPPTEARRVSFYLGGKAGERSCRRGGSLSPARPSGEVTPTSWIYDPRRPAPSVGGALLGWVLGVEDPLGGAQEQARRCGRADIRTFETAPLTEDLHLAGPLGARLYVASTAEDTAFTAKLVDVPGGAGPEVNIQDGITTLALRDRLDEPQRTPPGTVVEVSIDLRHTRWKIPAGHRLRLEVASSDFPQYHRHPNVFGPFADVAEPVVATQTLYHDDARPSELWVTALP